jgi:hypothetical protein
MGGQRAPPRRARRLLDARRAGAGVHFSARRPHVRLRRRALRLPGARRRGRVRSVRGTRGRRVRVVRAALKGVCVCVPRAAAPEAPPPPPPRARPARTPPAATTPAPAPPARGLSRARRREKQRAPKPLGGYRRWPCRGQAGLALLLILTQPLRPSGYGTAGSPATVPSLAKRQGASQPAARCGAHNLLRGVVFLLHRCELLTKDQPLLVRLARRALRRRPCVLRPLPRLLPAG